MDESPSTFGGTEEGRACARPSPLRRSENVVLVHGHRRIQLIGRIASAARERHSNVVRARRFIHPEDRTGERAVGRRCAEEQSWLFPAGARARVKVWPAIGLPVPESVSLPFSVPDVLWVNVVAPRYVSVSLLPAFTVTEVSS